MPIKNIPGRITSLFQQSLVVLTREIKSLSRISAGVPGSNGAKLSDSESKALVNYIKLLNELRKLDMELAASKAERDKTKASTLSDKEIEELLKKE